MSRVLVALLALVVIASLVLWRAGSSGARRAAEAHEEETAGPAPAHAADELSPAPVPASPDSRPAAATTRLEVSPLARADSTDPKGRTKRASGGGPDRPLGLTLSGVVRDDRGPVERFNVVVKPATDRPGRSPADARSKTFQDAGGRFELADLAAGEWDVTAYSRGHVRARSLRVTLPAPAPIELFVAREACMKGVVRDGRGAPVAGGTVIGRRDASHDAFGAHGERDGSTNWLGEFEVCELAAGSIHVRAYGPAGVRGEDQEHTLVAGETLEDIELVLPSGAGLVCEVVDEGGRGLADVVVSVSELRDTTRAEYRTDAKGRVEATGLPVGDVLVRAERGGFDLYEALQLREGETNHVRLVVRESAPVRLTGRLLVGREVLTGAHVNLHASAKGASCLGGVDENGTYVLTVPGPGRYSLSVSCARFHVSTSVEVPAVSEHVTDIVIPVGRVTGRVVDERGRPLARIFVHSQLMRPAEGLNGSFQTLTDAEGRYELEPSPGQHVLEAGGARQASGRSEESYVATRVEALSVQEGELVAGIDFVLSAGGTLAGSVRDSAGEPVPFAQLWSFEPGRTVLLGNSGPRGDYRLVGLAPGETRIGATGTKAASRGPAQVLIEVGKTARLELALGPAQSGRVRVRDASGAAVVCEIEVVDEHGQPQPKLLLYHSSEAALGALVPGRYRVRARSAERIAEREFEIAASGPELELELVLD